MTMKPAIALVASAVLALAGCTAGGPTTEQKHEMGCVAGTVSGAVVGGLLGSLVGGGTGQILAASARARASAVTPAID